MSQLLRLQFSTLESVVYFDRGPSDGDSAEHFGKMGDCVMIEMWDRQRAVYRARGTAESRAFEGNRDTHHMDGETYQIVHK